MFADAGATPGSPALVDPRSPLADDARKLGSQLEALRTLGRHAAGGLHADDVANTRVEDLARDAFKAALASHSASRKVDFAASLRSSLPDVSVPTVAHLEPVLAEVRGVQRAVAGLSDLLSGCFEAQRTAAEASRVSVHADLEELRDSLATQQPTEPLPSVVAAAAAQQLATFQQEVTASLEAIAGAAAQRGAATEAALRALLQQAEAREAAQAAADARLDRLEAAVASALGASGALAAQVRHRYSVAELAGVAHPHLWSLNPCR